jgi:pilus assembly protein CpaE
LALALATHSPLKIGYLDLNLKNPSVGTYLNLAESDKSNIRIRPLLQTQALSPAGLLDACIGYRRVKRLFILPGTARRETASDVTPEMINHLLTVARQTFDLTLLDLSGYPDNAATVCGVRGADIRLLTARPQFDSYRTGWGDWYDCYWKYCGLAPQEIALVMNRTTVHKDAINAADYLGMTLWGTLPDAPVGLGLRAVDEGQPLYYQAGAESFVAAIHDLAGRLAGETGVAFGFPERSKPRLWTRISALMG